MTARDPVCGMMVEEDRAAATSVYKGVTYYFCARGCKVAFDRDPEKYLGRAEEEKARKEGATGAASR